MAIETLSSRQSAAWKDRVLPPVEEVAEGVWALPVPIPNNPLVYTYCYALADGSGVVLIDPGWDGKDQYLALNSALNDLGFKVADIHGRADLVVANNVFAHVPDIVDFAKGLRALVADTGHVTIEIPHLLRLIEGNEYDTIYHEHFSYLSLLTTQRVLAAAGLTVVDVQELSSHGGSLRTWSTPTENADPPSEAVARNATIVSGALVRYPTTRSPSPTPRSRNVPATARTCSSSSAHDSSARVPSSAWETMAAPSRATGPSAPQCRNTWST